MSPRPADWAGASRRRPDVAAVAADDRLLDALGTGVQMGVSVPGAGGSADLLPGMLATWVDAIDSRTCDGRLLPPRQPHPAEGPRLDSGEPDNAFVISLPNPDEAATEGGTGMPKARRTAAMAAVAATVGLIGLIQVEQAEPGSVWWPLVELLDGDRADSAVAQEAVQQGLADVNAMVNDGRTTEAARELQQLETKLDLVLPEDGAADLAAQVAAMHEQISAMGSRPASSVAGNTPANPLAEAAATGELPASEAADPPADAPAPADPIGAVQPTTPSGESTSPTDAFPPADDVAPPIAEDQAQSNFPNFAWALSLLFPNDASVPPADSSVTTPPSAPDTGSGATEGSGPEVLSADLLPTDLLPTDVLQPGVLPTGVLPPGVLPTAVPPTDVLPPDGPVAADPSGQVPSTDPTQPMDPTPPADPSQPADQTQPSADPTQPPAASTAPASSSEAPASLLPAPVPAPGDAAQPPAAHPSAQPSAPPAAGTGMRAI